MNKQFIKKYQQEIREAKSQDEKHLIASKLHSYIATLTVKEQEDYKNSILAVIESKFEVMDKLIAAYDAIKKDDLILA